MKTPRERSQEATQRMKQKFQDYLDSDSKMSVRDLFEFTKAYFNIKENIEFDLDSHNTLCCHLLTKVDTEEDGIGEQPRYKLINKYPWALRNAVRDWNNRGEMGK